MKQSLITFFILAALFAAATVNSQDAVPSIERTSYVDADGNTIPMLVARELNLPILSDVPIAESQLTTQATDDDIDVVLFSNWMTGNINRVRVPKSGELPSGIEDYLTGVGPVSALDVVIDAFDPSVKTIFASKLNARLMKITERVKSKKAKHVVTIDGTYETSLAGGDALHALSKDQVLLGGFAINPGISVNTVSGTNTINFRTMLESFNRGVVSNIVDIAKDARTSQYYIIDRRQGIIFRFRLGRDQQGDFQAVNVEEWSRDFPTAEAIAVDEVGNVFVATSGVNNAPILDQKDGRIYRLDTNGAVRALFKASTPLILLETRATQMVAKGGRLYIVTQVRFQGGGLLRLDYDPNQNAADLGFRQFGGFLISNGYLGGLAWVNK